ncbi:hypothetical protein N7491_010644 [Penicillium cf. griseofulvum]|uniref:Uncharacterized protein n=1 Tax=Penicillium cf. griseofulvum TaxID=2972120 RepID=A0A9W9N130_9EURO|nr:hypothetical protein N7472_000972 [Penicillium cf. griseofulvum]KAJ5422199.1 hypothetical protein N7491_010644 [Penicillium cf. griseofulvum]KAJ5428384.1 hypothetical protein N7445_009838 [Penicillium cf. griseofulvum]
MRLVPDALSMSMWIDEHVDHFFRECPITVRSLASHWPASVQLFIKSSPNAPWKEKVLGAKQGQR